LSGFGKAKVDKYGDEILAFVEKYCSSHNIETNMAAKADNPKRERKEKTNEAKTPTRSISFSLFKEGKTLAEIAKERNLSIGTIEAHLAWYVETGEIDINKMVPMEIQQLIREAAKTHGYQSHKTLKDNLPESITYGEIRLVLASAKAA
jgi:ATP-dependent DNA helicase RecQ